MFQHLQDLDFPECRNRKLNHPHARRSARQFHSATDARIEPDRICLTPSSFELCIRIFFNATSFPFCLCRALWTSLRPVTHVLASEPVSFREPTHKHANANSKRSATYPNVPSPSLPSISYALIVSHPLNRGRPDGSIVSGFLRGGSALAEGGVGDSRFIVMVGSLVAALAKRCVIVSCRRSKCVVAKKRCCRLLLL